MPSRTKLPDTDTLEFYRVALENAGNQPDIAYKMAELGYDSIKLREGKSLWAQTNNAYSTKRKENDESSRAYALFEEKRKQLFNTYRLIRKKAKIIFRNERVASDKLAISGKLPRTYLNWLETVKKFYTASSSDKEIAARLARLKISQQDISAGQKLIAEVESTRAEYLREKGESQDATKIKDAAFALLDEWMSEFFAVAKIALRDSPQLMEALGKTVKS